MLYYPLNPDKSFVKRVIAEEGDTVRIVDGRVYVNDVPLRDDYVPAEYRSHDDWGPQVIPEGYYFVMGDHRNNSSDSRHWGFVPKKYIIGKVQVRWWPVPHGPGLLTRPDHDADRRRPPWLDAARFAQSGVLAASSSSTWSSPPPRSRSAWPPARSRVLSDGFHSLTDTASNIVALVGVRMASAPPDDDHPVRPSQVRDDGVGRHPAVPAAGAARGAVGGVGAASAPAASPTITPLTLRRDGRRRSLINLGVVVYERRAGRRLAERGAAGRRASHAERPADVGHGDRRAGRRAARLPRGSIPRRRSSWRCSSATRAGRSSATRRGILGDRIVIAEDDIRDVVRERARACSAATTSARAARRTSCSSICTSGWTPEMRARRRARAVARREGPPHGALPADQGRGHPHRAAARGPPSARAASR